jgi:aryl-alcohol dehydrogenase-like predicted oxidoreductase
MGLLTGKFSTESTFPEGDIRQNWPKEQWFQESLRHVDGLRPLEGPEQTLGQLALRFVLSHAAISVAIPGAKTPEQVEQNAGASRRPLLKEEECRLIDQVTLVPA